MPTGAAIRVWSRPHVQTLLWLLGALGIVSAGYVFVVYRNRGFFLVDDTESAILPMMAHLGDELRRGVWPAISERNWTVGLVAGDPQYSTFNPFSLFVYWAVEPLQSLVLRIFLIVLVYVNLLTVGVFWCARALGSTAPFAALAAVIAGLNVFILYWQAAGWVTLLPGVAWFAVATAALIAALDRPDRPWRAIGAGLATVMVVSSGNPFALAGFVLTAFLLVVCFVRRDRAPLRDRRLVIGSAISGAVLGAVPWVVSLNYIPYTRRQAGTSNNGFLTMHLESLLMSFSPVIRPFAGTFQGWKYLDQPATYGSWLFAGAVALVWARRVELRAMHWAVLGSGLVLFAWTIGPERLGPFRWPFRLMPFALILLALATVVVIERSIGAARRGTRDRRVDLVIAIVVLTALTFTTHASFRAAFVTALVLAVGVPFVVWCTSHGRGLLLVLVGLVSTAAVWVAIVVANPETTDLIDLNGPGDLATVQEDISPLNGHRTLQLLERMPDANIRTILANDYSLYGKEPAEVINGYTSLVPDELGQLLCLADPGYVCVDAASRIFEREPATGERYVDLFGVTQIMVQRGALLERFEQARSPEWVPVAESEYWVMYQNGTELGESPVVWTSEGGSTERVDGGDRVTLPADGQLVLSRPLWPGTKVTVDGVSADLEPVGGVFVGATFAEAVDGELTINQELPGKWAAIATAVIGVAMLATCVGFAIASSRRRRR